MHSHHSALGLASALRPVQPVTLIRPHAARRAARFFVERFPGRSLYAVKANPSPDLLRILWEEGVTHYDVASIAEVKLVAETLPEAVICFMHPVKAEEAIADAYFNHKVRTMSSGRTLRIETLAPAVVHWSVDGWRTVHDTPTRDTRLGVHVADLDTVHLRQGDRADLTFYWPEADRWEGTDFLVCVE